MQRLRLVRSDRTGHLPPDTRGRSGIEPFCRGDPGLDVVITDYREERQRSLVLDYFGNDARIRVLRRAEPFGAAIFVGVFDAGPRDFGTRGRSCPGARGPAQ